MALLVLRAHDYDKAAAMMHIKHGDTLACETLVAEVVAHFLEEIWSCCGFALPRPFV